MSQFLIWICLHLCIVKLPHTVFLGPLYPLNIIVNLKGLQKYGTLHTIQALSVLPLTSMHAVKRTLTSRSNGTLFPISPVQKDKAGCVHMWTNKQAHTISPSTSSPHSHCKTKACDERRCQMCIWWTCQCVMHTKLLHRALPRAPARHRVCLHPCLWPGVCVFGCVARVSGRHTLRRACLTKINCT